MLIVMTTWGGDGAVDKTHAFGVTPGFKMNKFKWKCLCLHLKNWSSLL